MADLWDSLKLADLRVYHSLLTMLRSLHADAVVEPLANPWTWTPLVAALCVAVLAGKGPLKPRAWAAFFGLGCVFISIQLGELLSHFIFHQPSPNAWVTMLQEGRVTDFPYSMPDPNVTFLSGIVTYSAVLLPFRNRLQRVALWLAVVPLAMVVRTGSGEAFPSHVLLGAVLGLGVGVLFLVFYRNFRIVVLGLPPDGRAPAAPGRE